MSIKGWIHNIVQTSLDGEESFIKKPLAGVIKSTPNNVPFVKENYNKNFREFNFKFDIMSSKVIESIKDLIFMADQNALSVEDIKDRPHEFH
jgi:hypothetical protein